MEAEGHRGRGGGGLLLLAVVMMKAMGILCGNSIDLLRGLCFFLLRAEEPPAGEFHCIMRVVLVFLLAVVQGGRLQGRVIGNAVGVGCLLRVELFYCGFEVFAVWRACVVCVVSFRFFLFWGP